MWRKFRLHSLNLCIIYYDIFTNHTSIDRTESEFSRYIFTLKKTIQWRKIMFNLLTHGHEFLTKLTLNFQLWIPSVPRTSDEVCIFLHQWNNWFLCFLSIPKLYLLAFIYSSYIVFKNLGLEKIFYGLSLPWQHYRR